MNISGHCRVESNLAAELGYRYFGAQVLLEVIYIYTYDMYIYIYLSISMHPFLMYWWWDDVLSCTFHVPFQYCFVSATVRGPKCVPPQGSWSTLDEYRKMWKQWRCSAGTVTDTIGQNEPWRRVYLLEDVGTSKPLPTNCGHSLMRVVQKKYTYIYIL